MKWKTALPLVLTLAVSLAACSSDPTTSEEYQSLDQKLAATQQELSEVTAELSQVVADRDVLAVEVKAYPAVPGEAAALIDDWWEALERGDGSVVDLYRPTGYHLYGTERFSGEEIAAHLEAGQGWTHEWITEPYLVTDEGDGRYVVTRGLRNSLGGTSSASALTFEIATMPDGQLLFAQTAWTYAN